MRILAKILPRKLKTNCEEIARYARVKDAERAIGMSIFMGILLAGILGFIFSRFFSLTIAISLAAICFFFLEIFFYYSISLKADTVARRIEKILPDALQLMASNLRGGMTTERALLMSSRIEFGELKHELDRVGREIATGKGVARALKDMSYRF